ncbi:MAG TPA: efflux RND transporter periplasmic adaptor subunit [Burkholderiaceae bacterium]|nr:efflux RND transporter periplasmic adaptor subunit [Burkholderiaceae bacterium]
MTTTNRNTVIAGAVMLALGLAAGLGGGWALSQWRGSAAHGAGAAPATAAAAAASGAAGERKVLYWYDPMVPTQKFDKPGKSPFMDMQLVPKYADEADANAAPGVTVSPAAQQSLGLRVAVADRRALAATIDAVGSVMLNERDVAILQSRAGGYVERVYARAPGDVIAAGAPIADVLLPEWLAAQQEFLAVKSTGDAALTAAARQRMVLLGMPAALVEQVAASGKPQPIQTLTAPIGGLLAELMVRPGMTVGMGMNLARINGLSTVWVEAAVPEALAAGIAPGQAAEVRLPATPGQAIAGKVAAVLPEANRDTRTVRVRVELPNPGLKLRAGMFAQVGLKGASQGEAVTVPAEAVVRTGRRALVYLLDAPGRYRPVEVELGPEVGERIVVRKGIEAGQQVVASGQFLIDSEATLQGVTARAATPASAPAAAAAAAEHHVNGVVSEAAAGGVITLQHEAVPALKWPAMTMPFQLAQPGLAKGLKAGDRVHFSFRQQGDEAVITAIQKVSP